MPVLSSLTPALSLPPSFPHAQSLKAGQVKSLYAAYASNAP